MNIQSKSIKNRFKSMNTDMKNQQQTQTLATPFHLNALARAMSFAFLMTLTAAVVTPSTAFAGEGHDHGDRKSVV